MVSGNLSIHGRFFPIPLYRSSKWILYILKVLIQSWYSKQIGTTLIGPYILSIERSKLQITSANHSDLPKSPIVDLNHGTSFEINGNDYRLICIGLTVRTTSQTLHSPVREVRRTLCSKQKKVMWFPLLSSILLVGVSFQESLPPQISCQLPRSSEDELSPAYVLEKTCAFTNLFSSGKKQQMPPLLSSFIHAPLVVSQWHEIARDCQSDKYRFREQPRARDGVKKWQAP